MAKNYGKKFEKQFEQDFLKIPGSTIDRIYDPGFKRKGISNICDFIGYKEPHIYYLECKSIKGGTFPLNNLTQYDKLIEKKSIKGAITGAAIWFYEKDKVIFVPITTFEKLKLDGKKSVNIKMLDTKDYEILEIPSIKKRVYMESDYTVLVNYGGV